MMVFVVLSVVAAYLLGAIPTAYIFGKALKGIDIREHGSGNVGATNVFRTVGKAPGIIVFILDFMKGFLAVTVIPFLLYRIAPDPVVRPYVYILLGAAAIGGHIWNVFLKFKGGKGVATTAGVMSGLSPAIFGLGLLVWVVIFAIWRYVSLASILAATALPILAVILRKDPPFIIFCSVLCVIGIFSHRSNIQRLLKGKEKKIV
ncbi:MAG: glycerol-3-phosphate 1-O-acyltransferase PlsY [Candidatus Omnitrophota bacterium]|jgi:glycerol-3-phosphate acyltransferase PlsY